MQHSLTISERIRGVRSAIASPRTPSQLKQSLIRQLHKLEAQRRRSKRGRARARKGRGPFGGLLL